MSDETSVVEGSEEQAAANAASAAANPADASVQHAVTDAAAHPADAVLARIENEVHSLMHSPLALANWVKSMVAEARSKL